MVSAVCAVVAMFLGAEVGVEDRQLAWAAAEAERKTDFECSRYSELFESGLAARSRLDSLTLAVRSMDSFSAPVEAALHLGIVGVVVAALRCRAGAEACGLVAGPAAVCSCAQAFRRELVPSPW